MEVYIVVKKMPATVVENGRQFTANFRTNEAVFPTEELANDFIRRRKKLKDRDDKGATFDVEPWHVIKKMENKVVGKD